MTVTARGTKVPKGDSGKGRTGGAMIGQSRALPYIFSFPAILAVSAMLAFPVLYGIWQSLYRAPELGLPEEFVGGRNYVDMFADPGFVVAQRIEMLDNFHVALDAQGRVLVHRMDRRDESAKTQVVHRVLPRIAHCGTTATGV